MAIRAVLAGILACGWVGAASASLVTYTYSGTVGYGYDHAGIFGVGPSLTGEDFRLIETLNTELPAYRYVDALQSLQFGGTDRGAPNAASLVVTIGGQSRTIADVEDYIYSGANTGKHLDFVKDRTGYEHGGFYVESPRMTADYGSALVLSAQDALFIGSYQFFDVADADRATYASFDVSSLVVTPGGLEPSLSLAAVPLPNTLALFGFSLIGLALVGSVLHRQTGA